MCCIVLFKEIQTTVVNNFGGIMGKRKLRFSIRKNNERKKYAYRKKAEEPSLPVHIPISLYHTTPCFNIEVLQ